MRGRRASRILLLASVVELLGISLVSSGVAAELQYGADLGHILITIGSAIVAAGSFIWAKVVK